MVGVGEEIKRRREELNMSQPQVAVKAGVAVSAVSQIENGRRSPNVGTLEKIAEALDVEVVDLFPKAQAPSPEVLEEKEWRRRRARVTGLTLEATELRQRWTPELAAGGLQEHRAFEITYSILGILGEIKRVLEGLEHTNKAEAHQVKRLREEEPPLLHLLKQSVAQAKTGMEFQSITGSVVFEQASAPPVETARRTHA